jgi:hypothetical protein
MTTSELTPNGVWDKRTQCRISRIDYSFEEQAGTLFIPELNNTDMSGCIKLFKALDPKVRHIEVLKDGKPDIAYAYDGVEWFSRRLDR